MCRRRGAAALVAWVAAAAVSASGSTSSADAALERARRATRAMTSTSHLRKKNAARGAGAPERMFLTGNSSLGRRGRRAASKRAHETPRVAVLCVGLVRGLRDPAHRQNMRNLLASVGVSARISVFAFLEAQSLRNETEADDGRCTQSQLTSLLNKMFRGYTIQLKMASLRERAGSFSPIPLAYARHYKTARAVDMMLLDEQERGLTYDWVLSLRIDSVALERKNVTDAPVLATSKWLQTSINATLAAPPGTVLLYQDFVWFADRPTALSMAAAWEVMKQNVCVSGQRRCSNSQPVAIDRCRYANSAWARECSLFTRVATDQNLSSVDLGRVASPSTGLAASSCSSHSSGDIVIDKDKEPQIAFGVFMLGRDAAVVPQCFVPESLQWRLWPSGSTYGDSHRRDLASVSHKWRHDAKC
mmetsp:Transcript_13669/g.42319  ORF Transcript_13669/g.42319 Transcript_13669/m.42319 type:complete len:417 (+) Transcript_13669:73-1323(+)